MEMTGVKARFFVGHFSIYFLMAVLSVCCMANSFAADPSKKNFEQRIKHLERLVQNQNLLEVFNRLQSLQREVSGLRGEMELLSHSMAGVKQNQKDIYQDLDQRIQELDNRLNRGVSQSPVLPVTDMAGDQQALSEQEGYQAALAILKAGKYDEAIEAFQIYLISYPSSDYAANAQYWMAEAYYVLKSYQSAISQFNKVISAYPRSRKVPDAYLKMGFSYYELKDWQNAKRALDVVMAKYASTTAARLASRRLKKMQQDGLI